MSSHSLPPIVVGTGLGSLGAVIALLAQGARPTVIDIGKKLPEDADNLKLRFRNTTPNDWPFALLREERNASSTFSVPVKKVFGSNYFIEENPQFPAHSNAFGGFSAGWGGAYLPPRPEDLKKWPVAAAEITDAAREVLNHVPHIEPRDDLSRLFSINGNAGTEEHFSPINDPLQIVLKKAASQMGFKSEGVGRSRLLTTFEPTGSGAPLGIGCSRCGHCMLGCPWDAIFGAHHLFQEYSKQGKIRLILGRKVVKISESSTGLAVHTTNVSEGDSQTFEASRIFLGAGAVGTPLILSNSLPDWPRTFNVLRTAGSVIPLFSPKAFPNSWPSANSQSDAFVEFLNDDQAARWTHVQVSKANELIAERIGLTRRPPNSYINRMRQSLFQRLHVALVNIHSDFGPRYRVELGTSAKQLAATTTPFFPEKNMLVATQLLGKAKKLLRKSGLLPIPLPVSNINNGASYHLGGSTPMSRDPKGPWQTDPQGRPLGLRNVHVVDASALSSLPATTIGLTIMANGYRIAHNLS